MSEKKTVAKPEELNVNKHQGNDVKGRNRRALKKENAADAALIDSLRGMDQEDVMPLIAIRAYELYEQRGRQEGMAFQDWTQAERDVLKDELMKI